MVQQLEWDDDFEDREFEDDLDDDDVYVPCPNCGAEIFDDSEQCPNCGHYITHSTSPWAGRSPAWILLAVLGIVAVIYMLLAV
jgi:hypothetical protein